MPRRLSYEEAVELTTISEHLREFRRLLQGKTVLEALDMTGCGIAELIAALPARDRESMLELWFEQIRRTVRDEPRVRIDYRPPGPSRPPS